MEYFTHHSAESKGQDSDSVAIYPTPHAAATALATQFDELSYSCCYNDSDGREIGCMLSFKSTEGTRTRSLRRESDGWHLGEMRTPRPLYRLPDLAYATEILVTESEQTADILRKIGMTATTAPGGGDAATATDWGPLANKSVVIFPLEEESDRTQVMIEKLSQLSNPPTIRVLRLPGIKKGEGLKEWLEHRDGIPDESNVAELRGLIDQCPVKSPPTAESGNKQKGPRKYDGPRLALRKLSDVEPELLEFLVPGMIPRGKLTLWAGDPGLGKSLTSLDIAARVTRGQSFFSDREIVYPPGTVIIFNCEDGAGDTIRPRFDNAGGDPERVLIVDGVAAYDPQKKRDDERGFSLDTDLPILEATLAEHPETRLLVIDPISGHCGDVNTNNNAQVRTVLSPLSKLANRYKVAILAIEHLNKSDKGNATYRLNGSIGFVAAARAAYVTVPDHQDPDRRLILPIKMNLAERPTGMAYRIISPGVVDWEVNPVEMTAHEYFASGPRSGHGARGEFTEGRSEINAVEEWLKETLASGPIKAKEMFTLSDEAGFTKGVIKRAKAKLGILSPRDGYGPGSTIYWRLPEQF